MQSNSSTVTIFLIKLKQIVVKPIGCTMISNKVQSHMWSAVNNSYIELESNRKWQHYAEMRFCV